MRDENWDKYLPKFKQIKMKKKKERRERKKKEYTPFPPEQPLRKEDIQMETGEYFLTQAEKDKKKLEGKKEKQGEKKRQKLVEKEE